MRNAWEVIDAFVRICRCVSIAAAAIARRLLVRLVWPAKRWRLPRHLAGSAAFWTGAALSFASGFLVGFALGPIPSPAEIQFASTVRGWAALNAQSQLKVVITVSNFLRSVVGSIITNTDLTSLNLTKKEVCGL